MKTKRKFYKRVVTLEFLSETPITDDIELTDLIWEGTHGSYSMRMTSEKDVVLNGKQAAKALLLQDSDPGFFGLNDDGSDGPGAFLRKEA